MMPGSHRLGCYLRSAGTPIGFVDFLEENEDDGSPWLGALVVHRDAATLEIAHTFQTFMLL